MATLTAGISASDVLLPVSGEIENGHYTIDSEAIYVHGHGTAAYPVGDPRRVLSVNRALAGTTAATHLSGATLARYYPDAASSGGGGLTVDNTEDPPAEVTSLVIPNAVIAGSEATVPIAVLSRTTTLTDAQIKALPTGDDPVNWVELVPAPGVGKMLHYVGGILICDTTEGFYEGYFEGLQTAELFVALGGNGLRVSASATQDDNELGTLLGSEAIRVQPMPPAAKVKFTTDASHTLHQDVLQVPAGEEIAEFENASLVLRLFNPGDGALTGGDPANTMKVTVLYMVIDL